MKGRGSKAWFRAPKRVLAVRCGHPRGKGRICRGLLAWVEGLHATESWLIFFTADDHIRESDGEQVHANDTERLWMRPKPDFESERRMSPGAAVIVGGSRSRNLSYGTRCDKGARTCS